MKYLLAAGCLLVILNCTTDDEPRISASVLQPTKTMLPDATDKEAAKDTYKPPTDMTKETVTDSTNRLGPVDAGRNEKEETDPVIIPPKVWPKAPEKLGGQRAASYFVPPQYEPATAMPLLILLHGYTGTAKGQNYYFGLDKVTQEKGVMLITPDGTANSQGNQFWNATDFCCDFESSKVDDVAYITGLIEEAQTYFNIDPKRIYLVGHSNGGFMSMRMACDRSDLIAGVVNFAGATWFDPDKCGNPGPVSVLQVHGTWDTVIVYDGKTPYTGKSSAKMAPINSCLSALCADHYTACLSDIDCKSYYSCLGQCAQKASSHTCYQGCWHTASDSTKALWMPTFTCGLSKGCYNQNPTKSQPGYSGAKELVSRWAKRNGCAESTQGSAPLNIVTELPGSDTNPTFYQNCPNGLSAELWTIKKGSHVPGFNANWSPLFVDWLLKQIKP